MCSVVPSELQKHQHRLALRALDLEVDRAAVRLDGGHCLSPNCFYVGCAFIIRRLSKPDAPRHARTADFDGLHGGRGGVRPRADGLSEISRRCGPAAGRGVCRRWRVRAGALPEGLFRHALLQAGERAGRLGGREAGAAARARTRRRASRRMRRRSMPGSPAISTARSASGSRSCAEHPRDVLAFRLAHFNNFWLGRPAEMRASVERVKPKWARDLPGYGTILSCHCFSLEECGDYAAAEPSGRAAIEIDPGDVWGTHAVAHIMEMQGRHAEGIAWLDELERNWEGAANLVHHLWWHRALFHLERREFDAVLDLYDRRFRNLSASADAGAAGPLHRRAERRLDAVPARAARHRCGQSLERDRRQGRGAHRRLPLGLHAAALDDGAGGDRPRGGRAADARCDARVRSGRGGGARRSSDRSRCRSARPCWRIGKRRTQARASS